MYMMNHLSCIILIINPHKIYKLQIQGGKENKKRKQKKDKSTLCMCLKKTDEVNPLSQNNFFYYA